MQVVLGHLAYQVLLSFS